MDYKIALLIGRFQPFHKGHLYLIKKALSLADKLIIGIGSANIHDKNNPLDYETRKKIVKAVVYKERLEDKVIKIVALDDFFNDKKWLENVKKQAGKFDLVVGNNDWTNNILEKAGYPVQSFPYFRRELYEGWRIRKLIKARGLWENRIPEYLVRYIKNKISNINPSITLRMTLSEVERVKNSYKKLKKYNHVVVGGTFDHLHKGHRILIDTAFKLGKKVTVGIATGQLLENKLLKESIELLTERKTALKNYLRKGLKIDKKSYEMITFSDFYGETLRNKSYDAIAVSKATVANAIIINEKRSEKGFPQLKIIIVEDVLADDGKLISSERIRAGEIDREGKNFQFLIFNLQKKKTELILPENLREELRKPLGRVFNEVHKVIKFIKFIKPTMLIAVGDIIVGSLLKEGLEPDVKVIDFKSRRQPYSSSEAKPSREAISSRQARTINKPGTINLKAAEKLRQLIQNAIYKKDKSWLIIKGEEDLLTLLAILFAPLGSLVLYGHWQLGIISVEVNEKIKEKVRKILLEFN